MSTVYQDFVTIFTGTSATAEGTIIILIGGIIISVIILIGVFRLFFIIGKLLTGR